MATLHHSAEIAVTCAKEGIPGAVVECGVAAGAQVAAMILGFVSEGDDQRAYHLFDSFEGIPLGCQADVSQPGIVRPRHDQTLPVRERLKSSGITVCSLAQVKSHLQEWGLAQHQLCYHAGWFQDTVGPASLELGPLAILRLDGDLYESTAVCLASLYDKVVQGGFIVVDDWALAGFRKAVHDFFAQRERRPVPIVVPGGGGPVYWRV